MSLIGVRVILGLAFVCLGRKPVYAGTGATAPVNQKEFKALCLFDRIAHAAEGQTGDSLRDTSIIQLRDEVLETWRDLQAMESAITKNDTQNPVRIEFEHEPYMLPGGEWSAALKGKVVSLRKKMEQVANDVNDSFGAVETLQKDAITALQTARFGPKGEKWATTGANGGVYTTQPSRPNTCKGDDAAQCDQHDRLAAGCSIAHDMFCLCIPAQSGSAASDDANNCGVTLSGGATEWHTSSMTGYASIETTWNQLKGQCERWFKQVQPNITTIERAMDRFEDLLGTGHKAAAGLTTTVENYQWVLGITKVTTSDACGGASSNGGACVDYGAASTTRKKNVWLAKFKTALEKLKEAEKEKQKLQRLARKAESIAASVHTVLIQLSLPAATDAGKISSKEKATPQMASSATSQKQSESQSERTRAHRACINMALLATLLR